jgi:hypothetical protein
LKWWNFFAPVDWKLALNKLVCCQLNEIAELQMKGNEIIGV